MGQPLPAGDDELPTGVPRDEGDDDDDRGLDVADAGTDDLGDESNLDDEGAGFEEGHELDDLPEPTTESWETAETEPVEHDGSLELPEEASWLGQTFEGAEAADPMLGDDEEGAPPVPDAGEEGFAEAPVAGSADDEAVSEIGAADDDGLDESIELVETDRRTPGARMFEVAVEPIASDRSPGDLVAIALDATALGDRALVLGREADGSVVLAEENGRLRAIGRVTGEPRVLLVHPSLGLVVATSSGLSTLAGAHVDLDVVALAALGPSLVVIDADGRLLSGTALTSLAPVRGAPARSVALTTLERAVLVADERGPILRLEENGRLAPLSSGVAHGRTLAAVAEHVVLLTDDGGAWLLADGEGFEPEPALRGASSVVAVTQGDDGSFLGLVDDFLVRVAPDGSSESAPLAGGRLLASGRSGSALLALTTAGPVRIHLPGASRARPTREGDAE